MPIKNFPAQLKSLIMSGWCKSYPAVSIKLNADISFHFSTIEIPFGDTLYLNRLYAVGAVKKSQTKSTDRVELTLNNGDGVLNSVFIEPLNAMDKAEATLYKIYENIHNPAERYRIERLSGVIRTPKNTQDRFISLSLIGDGYAGSSVVDYQVRKNCVWKYKDGHNCYTTSPLPDCDLSFDGANGCINHNGDDLARAMFGGHGNFLDEITATQTAPLGNTGGDTNYPDPRYGGRNGYPSDDFDRIPYRELENRLL